MSSGQGEVVELVPLAEVIGTIAKNEGRTLSAVLRLRRCGGAQISLVLGTKKNGDFSTQVDGRASRNWVTSTTALLRFVFGENGSHYEAAMALQGKISVWKHQLAIAMYGVLQSAEEAWDRGYVFEVKELAEAEVEANLMDQAEELLSKGYYQPAAVLAGSVLEQ